MSKFVDYEAVKDGDNFYFIKKLTEDGSIDARFGNAGPYAISSIAYGKGISISHAEELTSEQVSQMLKQFIKEYF